MFGSAGDIAIYSYIYATGGSFYTSELREMAETSPLRLAQKLHRTRSSTHQNKDNYPTAPGILGRVTLEPTLMSEDKPKTQGDRPVQPEVQVAPEVQRNAIIAENSNQARWSRTQQAHYLEQDESATGLFYKPGESSKSTGKFGIDGLDTGLPDERPANGSAEDTGQVIDYKLQEVAKGKSFALGMDYEQCLPNRSPSEKLVDFVQAATTRATDSDAWKTWAQGEINKFSGIGAGLTEAKDETKTAVVAGWKALTDGTVVEFLAQPNAINAPVFRTVANAFEAMGKDANTVNKAFEALGQIVIKASETYVNLPEYEKGKMIGKTMFGMVNPEGTTEGAGAALKVAEQIATKVDIVTWNTVDQTVSAITNMAPDVAENTKKMLYDYIKTKGLTSHELKGHGIPEGFFDGVNEIQGAGKSDNFIARSKAEALEGDEAQLLGKSGKGGDWPIINERPSADVVCQTKQMSCVSACGEMLSNGEFKQAELIKTLGAPCDIRELAEALGPPWKGKGMPESELDNLLERGPWAAELRELPPPSQYKRLGPAHTVLIDGLDKQGNIMIRDPADGTRYEMTRSNFLKHWTLHCVFRN